MHNVFIYTHYIYLYIHTQYIHNMYIYIHIILLIYVYSVNIPYILHMNVNPGLINNSFLIRGVLIQ